MNLFELTALIKNTRITVLESCTALGNDDVIDVTQITKFCGLLDISLKNIEELNGLSELTTGLIHARYLICKINRIAAKCEDTEQEHALSIYKSTSTGNVVIQEIDNFLG